MTEVNARKREEKQVRKPSKDKATVGARGFVMPQVSVIPAWHLPDECIFC